MVNYIELSANFSVCSNRVGDKILEYKEIFKTRLKLLIKYNNDTNANLSRTLGVSQGLITKYTTGHASPSFENLLKIADIYNVSLDYLTGKSNSIVGDLNVSDQINEFMALLETLDLKEEEEEIILKALEIITKNMKHVSIKNKYI